MSVFATLFRSVFFGMTASAVPSDMTARSPRPGITAMRPAPFLAVLLLAAVFLGACARPYGPGGVTGRAGQAEARAEAQSAWDRFAALSERARAVSGPFELSATLYYSGKEDSQRVSVYLWGNGEKTPLPLRLDILMGPGAVIAQSREDERGLFIYVPRDNLVYHAKEYGLAAFGVPVPFSLADLAALTTGRFGSLFVPAGEAFPPAPDAVAAPGGFEFPVNGPLAGRLTLSPEGLPLAWAGEDGWRMTVDYWPDSTRTTPRKLHVTHTGGEATLIVRELSHPDKDFAPAQLRLDVPRNTRLAPLAPAR